MDFDVEKLEITHNEPATSFEVFVDDRRAWLEYVRDGKAMIITHVIVHPDLRGQGLAEKLMRTGLEYARKNALRVVPMCAFANAYFRRHAEVRDLLK